MKWATRAGVHVDRAGCAWLIRRFVDPEAEFVFVTDPADVPTDATPFDMRGVQLGHHHGNCTFETALKHFEFTADPALEELGRTVHEADLDDDCYDQPLAPGLDALIRGVSLISDNDAATLTVTDMLFDGLYEYTRQRLLTGRPPA